MMLMFRILGPQVTAAEASILSLNINVSREGEDAAYVEVLLVPESECLELPSSYFYWDKCIAYLAYSKLICNLFDYFLCFGIIASSLG